MVSTVAVVPAAGSGVRLGAEVPKAFLQIRGVTLLERAVAGLRQSGVIDQIVVAVPGDRCAQASLLLDDDVVVVAGGVERVESVRLALAGVGRPDFVLVHDAARPLTPPAVVVRVIEALCAGQRAVVPVIPVVDTIKAVDANGAVLGTPERCGLRAVQTPQGFAADLLLSAYRDAGQGQLFTDDAGMVAHVGGQVHTVEGDPLAFKITTPLDVLLAEAVLSR